MDSEKRVVVTFAAVLAQFLMLIPQILYRLSHPPASEKGTIVLNDYRQETGVWSEYQVESVVCRAGLGVLCVEI